MQVGAMSQAHDGRLETPRSNRCIRGRGPFLRIRSIGHQWEIHVLRVHLSQVRVSQLTVLFRSCSGLGPENGPSDPDPGTLLPTHVLLQVEVRSQESEVRITFRSQKSGVTLRTHTHLSLKK